jgi:hypothetical protein
MFLAAFAWLRGRSTFLARERDTPAAAALSRTHGVPLADALALGAMLDDADAAALPGEWSTAVAAYARERVELGDPLAAVAAWAAVVVLRTGGRDGAGDRRAAEAALAATRAAATARRAAPDASAAWQRFRAEPAAVQGLRFLQLRERYAGRGQSRD